MSFKSFVGESGLKVLAMARLSQSEYSVMLYLLNCAASGLDELITTERDLATLIGYSESEVQKATIALSERGLVRTRYSETVPFNTGRQALRIGIHYDVSSWRLNFGVDVSSQDAIVFPFRRGSLQLVSTSESKSPLRSLDKKGPTWRRVLESYIQERELDESHYDRAERDAQTLVETYTVDQILLMLRHFGRRIPTLSLLASSWRHYQELYEQETMHVDMLGARKKHCDLDQKLRVDVLSTLEKAAELSLDEEEKAVLELLSQHSYPRRQLFWAYQSRSRYPQLKDFFQRNSSIMLPVTSSGQVLKKKPHQDTKT